MKKAWVWIVILILTAGLGYGSFYVSSNNLIGGKEEEKKSDEEIVEELAKKYMKAYEKLDSKAIIKMMYKDQAYDYEDYLDDSFEYLEDNDFEIKEWEILGSKELKGDDLEDFQFDFEDEYDVEPSEVISVKVKVKVAMDGETNENKSEIHFAKIKGKWYLVG